MEIIYQFFQNAGFNHPLHPPLAHMPIGLIIGAFIFLLLGLILKRQNLQTTAYHCLVLALVFFFPTVLLGITDWMHFYSGLWSFPIIMKMVLCGFLAIFLVTGVMLEIKRGGSMKKVIVNFLCVVAVVGLGYFGGQLVFAEKGLASPDDVKQGERLYAENCGGCHPNGGNIINPALPVIGSPRLKSLDAFTAFNRNPVKADGSKGVMPAFPKEKLSDQEMKQIYQYITTVLAGKK